MSAYYNENDLFAAAWLRELIKDGLIANGEVDTRSIRDVRAPEIAGFTQHHFFAGIGGWSYALRLAGWPDDRPVWTGSCPCQPFSAAGKRKGTADDRHLWPEFARLIGDGKPPVVFGEQVASKDGRLWLAGVRSDLEALVYAVGAADLCAAGVGAPHIRQRLFWVANSQRDSRDAGRLTNQHRESAGAQTAGPRVELGRRSLLGSGLADAHGGIAGHGELQSGGEHRQQPQDGGIGGLQHATRDGREQRRPEPGQWSVEPGRAFGGVGNTNDSRSQGRRINTGEHTNQRTAWPSSLPCNDGAGERGFTGYTRPPSPAGAWEHSIFSACADGKARRVEPGIFPLAHGVPNRVGTLRGAGNAIVSQVAAEFIQAYLEALG